MLDLRGLSLGEGTIDVLRRGNMDPKVILLLLGD